MQYIKNCFLCYNNAFKFVLHDVTLLYYNMEEPIKKPQKVTKTEITSSLEEWNIFLHIINEDTHTRARTHKWL